MLTKILSLTKQFISIPSIKENNKALHEVLDIAKGELSEQDVILLIAAVFPNNRKITNMIEVHKVSELLGYFGGRT